MDGRPAALDRYLAIWNGEAGVDELDSILAPGYRGHIGSNARTADELRHDILAYRKRLPGVRFSVEHQFGDGEYIATRLTATPRGGANGEPASVAGMNISRWQDGALVEEWAVWEQFPGQG